MNSSEKKEGSERAGNFVQLWRELSSKDPEYLLCRVASARTSRAVSFRVQTALRRVARYSAVFREELKLEPGSRVMLFNAPSEDMFLLCHGIWCAGLSVVLVNDDFSLEEIIALLKKTNVKTVIFPTAFSAKVSQLFLESSPVQEWLLCGASASVPRVPGLKKLEELVTAVGDSSLPEEPDSEAEAIIAVKRTRSQLLKAASFSQRAICHAGRLAASLHPELPENVERENRLHWSSLDTGTLNGLVQSVVVPLFSPAPILIRDLAEPRKFWEQTVADNVNFAVMDEKSLRIVSRRGKSRSWRKPDDLRVLLYAESRLSRDLLEGFEERFGVPILPCYSMLELGGVALGYESAGGKIQAELDAISVNLQRNPDADEDEEPTPVWEFEFSVPSCGRALEGVVARIVDPNGLTLPPERAGRVKLQSPAMMKGYLKGYEGDASFDAEGYLFPEDEGFYMMDRYENVDFFVTGRSSDFVVRRDKRINLSRIENVLKGLKGVQGAIVLGFENRHSGVEIGAYVFPLPAANLKEYELAALSRRELSWHEAPKVIILAQRNSEITHPSRETVKDLFRGYAEMDYTRGEDAIDGAD